MSYDYTILLAHGSRDPNWARPFEALLARIKPHSKGVRLAYMELAEPSLEAVVAEVAAENPAARIAVLPLFFAAGRHLRVDVPQQIDTLTEELGCEITLLPAIGEQEVFADFLKQLVLEQLGHGKSA